MLGICPERTPLIHLIFQNSLSNYKNTQFLVRPSTVTKNAHGDTSGTKRGIINPLLSKRPEIVFNKKIKQIETTSSRKFQTKLKTNLKKKIYHIFQTTISNKNSNSFIFLLLEMQFVWNMSRRSFFLLK